MNNTKLPAYPELANEITNGNYAIADFMPNMLWIIPKNIIYPAYWRKLDGDGLPMIDYKTGRDIDYHKRWDVLKLVIDYIFTFSLAHPEQTKTLRGISIVVDIMPAWRACVNFAVFYKVVLEEANK